MTEIRFYHLQTMSAEQALPGLVSRAYENGNRVLLRLNDAAVLKRIDDILWTHNPNSFLPHGAEGNPADHPVWLTMADDNPNGADTLISLNFASESWDENYSLVCLMFDGRDSDALAAARVRWKTLKDSGKDLAYWQQTQQGGWEKKQ